ncbi:hypothetical protein [Cytobacillus sp. IB215316]|uniref:hypothetical protein n=1 Tax=Cytobacillus sp. IB215316 TaxID=3097354 RepID=UPI002A16A1D0|nr:hypothetical protein [Cytobacillus sp. IB215316]MDX8362901.1 hypothetical protein [Cytobacillus sp. IB215316]
MYNNDIFKDFGTRLESILIYKPLLELDRKERIANIPLSSICLSILLFMIDNMLHYKKNNTYNDIAKFLQRLIKEKVDYDMSFPEAQEKAILIVREYLRNNGQQFVYDYYDFEKDRFNHKRFHLIDFEENYDVSAASKQSESFVLTPEAIEGLFKTKEMFQEIQVTIMQMYFRQQIDRGVFDGAIRTVEEIIFVLRNRHNEMKNLIKTISKDVLQVAREKEFEKTIQRYDETLRSEKEAFAKLKQFVEYTLDKYYKGDGEWTEKEEKAIHAIRRIQRMWSEAMQAHEVLFSLKQDLQKTFTDNIENLMFNSFHTNINFEKEVLSLAIDNLIDLDGMRKILKPLNPIKPSRLFHPSIFFEPQKMKKEYEKTKEAIPELTPEQKRLKQTEDRKRTQLKIAKAKVVFEWLFNPLLRNESYEMNGYIHSIPEEVKSQDEFYIALIQMHQRRYISFKPIKPELQPHLDEFTQALLEFINESEINKVCSSASINLKTDEFIVLQPLGKEISNFIVRRNYDD